MATTPDEHGPDERGPGNGSAGLGAAESLRILREQQERARTALEPDGRLLCLTWGIAWLVGYLVLWSDASGPAGVPGALAFAIFGGLLLAAVVITIVHSSRRTAGTRGANRRAGALWGFAWFIAFATFPFVISGIARAGASDEVIGLVANALACTIVGVMYLSGGACFADTGLYVLGAWIVLTGAVATVAGIPAAYLVMALLGGGGFLLITVVWHVIYARRARRVRAAAGQDRADG